jgi:hypothetical protein
VDVATNATNLSNQALVSYANQIGVNTTANNATTITPVAASVAATAGTPQSASTGAQFTTDLQATVRDGANNLMQGVLVTFTAPGSGASGTFPGAQLTATATTNASGIATAPHFTANATVGGPYTVTGTVSGVATPAAFSLTNVSTNVSVTINVPAGITFTMDGNPQTGSQTLSLAPGNHTLATTSPQSTGAGSQAVFAGWSDSGAISHTINVVSSVTITGTFTTQYQFGSVGESCGGWDGKSRQRLIL